MRRARQAGASALMILLVMALILVAFFAAYTLSRVSGGGDERADTSKRLAVAAAALDRFAGANGRLPCPANPTLSVGLSDPAGAVKKCNHADDGTLPWATLGLNSDAGLDGWGRKISYRVYTGGPPGPAGKGSLTQARGVDMVQCDITDPTAGDTDADGLCTENADVYQRSTNRDGFLAGKGLTVNDFGTAHADAAYVLISHGSTGLGAWTIAGTMLDMPAGDERDNTGETGPFTIKAFSDPDTAYKAGTHFDDQLVYVTIPDLVKRIGLEAREWPEIGQVVLSKANIESATGTAVDATTGDTHSNNINFSNAHVQVSGFSGGSTPTNISYDANAGGSGGTGGIGIAGGSAMMSSALGERLRVEFDSSKRKFAIALDNFGTTVSGPTTYVEKVELQFYDSGGTQVGSTITLSGCRPDGGLATFADIDPGGSFVSVDIVPVAAVGTPSGSSDSAVLVSEINGCSSSSATCATLLPANSCP